MAEECTLMQKGNNNPKQSPSKGQRSCTLACEDTAIAVLSSGLKRPLLSQVDNDDDDGPASKKQCHEQKHDNNPGDLIHSGRAEKNSPVKGCDKTTVKTSPGKPPKYRASSPTIMTTRGKSQQDKDKDSCSTSSSTSSQDKLRESPRSKKTAERRDSSQSKKSGTCCAVPGCRVTGCNDPGVKWYRIPKDDRLRQIWLNKIGRPDLDHKEHHRICSNHFVGGRKTFDNLIPTVRLPISSGNEDGYEVSGAGAMQGKTPVISNKNTFLSNKPWYSRGSITGNSVGSMCCVPGCKSTRRRNLALKYYRFPKVSNKPWYSRWSITGNSVGSMCCVPGCKSTRRRNLALKYYRFPKEKNLWHQWLASIRVRHFMPRDNSRVCSAHFEGSTRSDKNSVPTIFSPDTVALQNMKMFEQQQVFKQEPLEETAGEDSPEDQFFHRQVSPRKQPAPQRQAGPKTYGNYCCVPGCNSRYINNPRLSFYRIPRKSKPLVRQQWLDAIGAHNITSSEARVCSLHFEGGRKSESRRVPTIFPTGTSKSPTKTKSKQKSPSYYETCAPKWKKCPSVPSLSTPQSNIETLLQASDILSQREAESRASTPTSSNSSPIKDPSMESSHLLPETPRGSSCMVPGCNNTRSNSKGRLRWYRVPKDETQRKLWLNAIGWPNAVPTDTTRICSAHFMEGIYRKKGDKAVPTIFPPKPKDWQERHPQFVHDRVKVEPDQDMILCTSPISPSHSIAAKPNPSSPRSGSPRGDQQHGVMSYVTRNHFQGHPYGPTMLRPEMFERSPKQQASGESRGVTCCIARCHNNTKRTPGLRWYRIPADPTVRQQWLDFIRVTRPDFSPKNHHRVCSAHFEGGMKLTKSSLPTIYDKPFNRRFLPPADYQQLSPPDGGTQQQVTQDVISQQQQPGLQQQQSNVEEVLGQQGPKMEVESETGSADGDETPDVCRIVRTPNSSSQIRERCIPPLTYRDNSGLVYLDNQDVEVSHEVSIPYNVHGEPGSSKAGNNDDLALGNVLPKDMLEPKKRGGGGGQCFVPGCTNTRRHNPGLKWYRIPKDTDLRILWLDNIGCPQADPKPHNRVCSDHFEGGHKQFNTSLPTVEKWSDTSKHVYTSKPVIDPSSSVVGSTLLAVDDNPVAVDAGTSRLTPSAAEMQSLADSLTALAAELGVGATSVDGTPLPSTLDSATNDALSLTSDNLRCLETPTFGSRSRSTSRSSSVAMYAPSLDEDGMANLAGGAVNGKPDGSDSQDTATNAARTQDIMESGATTAEESSKDSSQEKLCKTVSLEDKLPVKPPIFKESEGKESGADENSSDKYHFDKSTHIAKQEKMSPEERIQYLEGLVQSMCEELRFKEQRLQEKECDLSSCRQRLMEKDAECERIKRKCLMMTVRLGSSRKLAQTDL